MGSHICIGSIIYQGTKKTTGLGQDSWCFTDFWGIFILVFDFCRCFTDETNNKSKHLHFIRSHLATHNTFELHTINIVHVSPLTRCA